MLILMLIVVVLFFSLIPYFIARSRGVANSGWLLFVNLFFGWTVVGWIICMVWAIFGETEAKRRYWEQMGNDTDQRRSPSQIRTGPDGQRQRVEPHF